MKRKLPEKFFEQNQRANTRKWKFFNLSQALWGAGNREFRVTGDRGESFLMMYNDLLADAELGEDHA